VCARIEVQVTGDEALVTVRGVIDRTTPGLAAGLAELGEGCRAVVVDLREAMLVAPGVEDLVASLRQQAGTDRIALVCDRLPGRRLLRLACGASGVRILDEVPPGAGRRLPKPNRPVPVAERRRPRAPQVAEAV